MNARQLTLLGLHACPQHSRYWLVAISNAFAVLTAQSTEALGSLRRASCNRGDVLHIKRGDHSLVVAEVIEAVVRKAPEGRADDAILWMKNLGEKVFYGG